jgi:hypothetical protein
MINEVKVTKLQNVTKKFVESITCDVCGKNYSTGITEEIVFEAVTDIDNEVSIEDAAAYDNTFEIQEFKHLHFIGGYGSVFGDSDTFKLDICQHCLKSILGPYIRKIDL